VRPDSRPVCIYHRTQEFVSAAKEREGAETERGGEKMMRRQSRRRKEYKLMQHEEQVKRRSRSGRRRQLRELQ
jgi:hypothetical protein